MKKFMTSIKNWFSKTFSANQGSTDNTASKSTNNTASDSKVDSTQVIVYYPDGSSKPF